MQQKDVQFSTPLPLERGENSEGMFMGINTDITWHLSLAHFGPMSSATYTRHCLVQAELKTDW